MFDEVSTIAHVGEKGVKSESSFLCLEKWRIARVSKECYYLGVKRR